MDSLVSSNRLFNTGTAVGAPDIAAEHAALLGQLRRLADPGHRTGSLRVAPTAQSVLGVRTPASRSLARTWFREHPGWPAEATLALAASLWSGHSRDERALALEILCLHPDLVDGLDRSRLDRWRSDVDNWGICDFLGFAILGRWLLAVPGRRSYLDELIEDSDLWSRRLALVATVRLNREDDAYADITLRLVDRVVDEREPMITKAVSWALREMIRRHPDRVADYLDRRGDRLAAIARREVRNKLRTGRKRG